MFACVLPSLCAWLCKLSKTICVFCVPVRACGGCGASVVGGTSAGLLCCWCAVCQCVCDVMCDELHDFWFDRCT